LKIEALNGVRGFAVLLVLFYHASNYGLIVPNLSFSGAGRYGVFLFFTLSAFLLTSQFFMIDRRCNSFKKWLIVYFEKRLLRITLYS
jgi:peptidoglycan/LPS O-acetylase OafA/YrhL